MSKKGILGLLGLAVVIWYISRYAQSLLAYSTSNLGLSFSGSECTATGYPLALCVNDSGALVFIYSFLNITVWFVVLWIVLWVIKKFLLKR